jgi:hypothetical protein
VRDTLKTNSPDTLPRLAALKMILVHGFTEARDDMFDIACNRAEDEEVRHEALYVLTKWAIRDTGKVIETAINRLRDASENASFDERRSASLELALKLATYSPRAFSYTVLQSIDDSTLHFNTRLALLDSVKAGMHTGAINLGDLPETKVRALIDDCEIVLSASVPMGARSEDVFNPREMIYENAMGASKLIRRMISLFVFTGDAEERIISFAAKMTRMGFFRPGIDIAMHVNSPSSTLVLREAAGVIEVELRGAGDGVAALTLQSLAEMVNEELDRRSAPPEGYGSHRLM